MKLFVLYILLLIPLSLKAQRPITCDSVYLSPDTLPHYKNGVKDLMAFGNDSIITAISKHCGGPNSNIYSLRAKLLIRQNGTVTEVTFWHFNGDPECRKRLEKILLNMKGWKPAIHKGKPVCCYAPFVIGCIRWH